LKQRSFRLSQIKKIAAELWMENRLHKVWAFHAPMGAGKTTLIHALCDILEVHDAVGSPTFAIINEYTSTVAGTIYHMDWYRLKDEMEAIQAGCEDCILSGNLCFIEWPEKCAGLLPDATLNIYFEIINEHERSLTIHLPV
jgi:tRNA threonylcarbamoyladenosine biosynthesis protein TsaE